MERSGCVPYQVSSIAGLPCGMWKNEEHCIFSIWYSLEFMVLRLQHFRYIMYGKNLAKAAFYISTSQQDGPHGSAVCATRVPSVENSTFCEPV
jgi:hypothetical protein